MIETEVFGVDIAPQAPPARAIHSLCERVAKRMGVEDGHVAVEFVREQRIAQLNAEHRGTAGPTDVLSFPIDGVEPLGGASGVATRAHGGARAATVRVVPRELGDVVICPQHTVDIREAIVHGMLHLLGMDHETDDGQMLAVQRELLAENVF